MGLFSRRRKSPISVGSALCVADQHGRGWVREQCHADLPPDTIALLAATTFMVEGATVRAHRHLPVAPWLEATRTAACYPDAFNETMNSSGISPVGLATPPAGARMRGTFVLTPASCLTGEWDTVETFEDIALASRLFGVLVAAATWCDVDDAVEHAARRLDETADHADFTRPHVMEQLPQMLTTYGQQESARARLAGHRHREDPGRPASL
jgi:hypothetical protein